MKRLFVMCAVAALAAAALAAKKVQSPTEQLKRLAASKRYVQSRDFATIPGYVITTWYRNGEPDWIMPAVVTSKVEVVTGSKVKSPVEAARDEALARFAEATNRLATAVAAYSSATNRVALLEAWKAGRQQRAENVKTQIQSSKLLTNTLKTWLTGLIDQIVGEEGGNQ